MGLDGAEQEALLGALRRMGPVRGMRAMQRMTAVAASRGSRAEMEKNFAELPPHIKQGLKKGELRLADTIVYSIKPITSKTVKIFETQDDKETGLRSISNAKLPRNQALLVSGIVMLVANPVDATKDKVLGANFDRIENMPAIANGEWSLKANKKVIVPEGTSTNVFKTLGMTNVPVGYYKLANPRLIPDDLLIEFTVELGSMEGLSTYAQMYIGLHGTITTP
jgi:hypothetical protein